MSPVERLDKDTPPFLIIHGKNDQTIPVGRALVFKRYMDAAKRSATLEIMDDASHGFCYGMHTPAQRHAAECALSYLDAIFAVQGDIKKNENKCCNFPAF